MYILKCILISLDTAVFFIKILSKYYCYMKIHLLGNLLLTIPFKKLQYQRQAGYLKNLGINCTSRKFCAQNTVRLFDEIHIIYSKKYANIGKSKQKGIGKSKQKGIGELKKTDTKI